jgi:hypothetical protein
VKVYEEFTRELARELGRPAAEVDDALALFAEIDVDAHRAATLLRGAALARYNLRRFAQSLVAARLHADRPHRRLPLAAGHRLERAAWHLIDTGRFAPAGRLILRLLG